MQKLVDTLLANGLVPDVLIRKRIRKLLLQRLKDETAGKAPGEKLKTLIAELDQSPVAVNTNAANEQHYEVPAEFYKLCLGKNLKYSCAHWSENSDLNKAEEEMLNLTCDRAQLKNGQEILELGCGWGSLTLYMAEKYPQSTITAVSNSHSQKKFIDAKASERGLSNIQVITSDINFFKTHQRFDRVVSIEMFEHMRNYRQLLTSINEWLKPEGLLFVHIFVHKQLSYKFEVKDESDWMSRYFFTGGIMPGDMLLYNFDNHLLVRDHWRINGQHYGKTAEAWLQNMDERKSEVLNVFKNTYGVEARKWRAYWRIFFMSCAELWNFNGGEEWFVSHYLFEKKSAR